jgi:hypothetical protein
MSQGQANSKNFYKKLKRQEPGPGIFRVVTTLILSKYKGVCGGLESLRPVNVLGRVSASPRARTCIFATTPHFFALNADYLPELMTDLKLVVITSAHTGGDNSGE